MTAKKNVWIQMKVTPEFKEQAKKQAKREGRSLTNYLEWLVVKDAARTEKS